MITCFDRRESAYESMANQPGQAEQQAAREQSNAERAQKRGRKAGRKLMRGWRCGLRRRLRERFRSGRWRVLRRLSLGLVLPQDERAALLLAFGFEPPGDIELGAALLVRAVLGFPLLFRLRGGDSALRAVEGRVYLRQRKSRESQRDECRNQVPREHRLLDAS